MSNQRQVGCPVVQKQNQHNAENRPEPASTKTERVTYIFLPPTTVVNCACANVYFKLTLTHTHTHARTHTRPHALAISYLHGGMMDVVNQLVAQGQFRVLKVPLGFIKVLQWFFAIFAFSTCGSYSGLLRVAVDCKNQTESDLKIEVEFEYPFRLHQEYFDAPTCKDGNKKRFFLTGDYSSSAEFFVTIAVFAFLYSTATLSIYIFIFEKYKENNKGPLIDLGVTAVFAFMWLVSSAAWAKGLSAVKTATDPDKVITMIDACNTEENRCREVHDPVMSGLNTSVAFGFINLVLWVGNLWFVFKETGIIAPFMRAPPPQQKPASDGQQGLYKQDPYASNQGEYQPEYIQQGYDQDVECGQQGPPTSFSNQM